MLFGFRKEKSKKSKNVRGFCRNPSGRPKKDISVTKIAEMKREGRSNRQIARELGCSESTIRKRIAEMKLQSGKFSSSIRYGNWTGADEKEHKGD